MRDEASLPKDVLKHVRRIEISTGRLINELFGGRYHSAFRGRGMEFAEVREYAPGDDVRAIDWNVTARTGRPFVKKFVEERELTVVILLDASLSQRFGSRGGLKSERAAEVTALLSLAALRSNDKAGLVLFSSEVEAYIPPRKTRGHALRLIREALAFRPRRPGTSIRAALEFLNKVQRRRAVAFLVSDFLDDGYERALRLAKGRHDVVAVRLWDPWETALPGRGRLSLEDAETGAAAVLPPAAQRGLSLAHAAARAGNAELLRRAAVDAVDVRTDAPYAESFLRFFQGRARRLRLVPLFFLLAASLRAAVGLETSLEPRAAAVGDRITLTVRVSADGARLEDAPSGPALGPFEVLDAQARPGPDGRMVFVYTLTAFDVGVSTLPALAFAFQNVDGSTGAVRTPEIPVVIRSVLTPEDKDIRDIVGDRWFFSWTIAAVAAALVLIAALLLRRRRRRGAAPPGPPPRPAHEAALEALARLEADLGLPAKVFYSALADALRAYLEGRFRLPALERTTAELLPLIRTLPFADLRDPLRDVLETADLAKFAKFDPSAEERRRHLDAVRDFVTATRPAIEPVLQETTPP